MTTELHRAPTADDPAGADGAEPVDPDEPRSTVVSGLAMVATAVLSFRNLGSRSFWMDEGFSVYLVTGSNAEFVERIQYEEEFVLYHLLLRAWSVLGSSEVIMRSLSVLFAVLTIPVVFSITRRLFGQQAAAVAVALLAVNGVFIGHAQEARPYALAALTSAVSTLSLLRALERPASRRRWIEWVVACALALGSHPLGGLVVIGHLGVLLLRRRTVPWRRVGAIVALPALAIAVMLIVAAKLGSGRINWVPRAGVDQYLLVARFLAGGRDSRPLLLYGCGTLALLFALATVTAERRRALRSSGAVALCLLGLPIVAAGLISTVQPIVLARYLIVVLPPLVVVVGAGIGLARPLVAAVGTAALVWVSIPGAKAPIRDELRQDWRQAVAIVAQASTEDDVAVVTPVGFETFVVYLNRGAPPHPAPVVVTGGSFMSAQDGALAPCRLRTVWLVVANYGVPHPVESLLEPTHALSLLWDVEGVRIGRFDRRVDAGPPVPIGEPCP
jgi:hypothetical protein